MNPTDHDIIFYDGLCGLCNAWVQFVLKRDTAGKFYFASLQSALAAKTLQIKELPDSVVLRLADGSIRVRTEATLTVFAALPMPWPVFAALMRLVPGVLRNGCYDFLAKRRYRLFGRYESCPLPKPEWKQRFLDGV
jgi:predicted DCC family thiol-disulfide oxidoreductase YuxK